MENGIYIIYPERRVVSPETIMTWANDAYANGDSEYPPSDVSEAIFILQDAGMITVQDRGIY